MDTTVLPYQLRKMAVPSVAPLQTPRMVDLHKSFYTFAYEVNDLVFLIYDLLSLLPLKASLLSSTVHYH
jgi:hypothetical protein